MYMKYFVLQLLVKTLLIENSNSELLTLNGE